MNDVPSAFRSLSVIIPAYNAGRCIAATLSETRRWLDHQGVPTEIIVVDDGSRDDTRAVVQRAGGGEVRLLCNPHNRGKGYSVRRGMLASCMDWALFMDADNSTSITHLARMADDAPSFPIIIASRRLPQSRIIRRQPMLRQMLGDPFPTWFGSWLFPEFAILNADSSSFAAMRCRKSSADRLWKASPLTWNFCCWPSGSTTPSRRSPWIGTTLIPAPSVFSGTPSVC